MNNTAPHLCLITQDHVEAIASYYPNFDLNHIGDVSIKSGIIKFKYEGSTYICNYREKNKQTEVTTAQKDIFQVQSDLMKGFLSIMGTHQESQSNVNFIFLELIQNILTEYFQNLDISHVEDLHISGGHVLFRYYKSIYMCPIKHMYEFKNGQSLKDEVVKISDVIAQYYPKIDLKYIRDIMIESGLIVFKYMSEMHSCPLKPPSELQDEYHQIRESEKTLYIQESAKKAVLRVVK